jgi:hypothetical protein
MKLAITIEYNGGVTETYVAQPPEWAKWESKTGFTIQQAQDKVGISDLMFLAYHAMKRSEAGKPVKPFDVWMETVVDVTTGDNDPKVISAEA